MHNFLSRGQQTFPVNVKKINILDFSGHKLLLSHMLFLLLFFFKNMIKNIFKNPTDCTKTGHRLNLALHHSFPTSKVDKFYIFTLMYHVQ